MLASTAGPVLAPDRWYIQGTQRFLRAFCCARRSRARGSRSRGGRVDARGTGRTGRIEGWSGAPIASRLPAIGLVALVGLGAVVRPAAPIVFVGLVVVYLFLRSRGERPAALAALLPAAAILVWRSIPQPAADVSGADCASLLAPPAVWRVLP